jgi:hypothetical protein
MALILVDPFAEVVVFGKAYPVAWPPPGATSVKALLPTGRHVSHANALLHVRNSRGGGGKATKARALHRQEEWRAGHLPGARQEGRLSEMLPRRRNTSPHSAIPTASKSGRRLG